MMKSVATSSFTDTSLWGVYVIQGPLGVKDWSEGTGDG